MKTKSLTTNRGLVTSPGAWAQDDVTLQAAYNVDLSDTGVIAKRRGFSNNTLNSFSGCILGAYSTPALQAALGEKATMLAVGQPGDQFSSGFRVGLRDSTFAAITGSWPSDLDARPKVTTCSNGKDVITTYETGGNAGLVVPDYNALTARYLGVPRGMGLDRLNTAGINVGTGWLASGASVRYAVCFVYGDPTLNNSQRGAPGMTTVFANAAGGQVDVGVTLLLPFLYGTEDTDLVADEYWVEVYRSSAQTTTLGEPPSELALVYQQQISAADIAAGVVQFVDIVPDSARGANLYTNILTGEDGLGGRGFINSNEPPPSARDVATWAECLWAADVQDFPSVEVQLISVGGTGLVAGDTLTVSGTVLTAVSPGPPVGGQFVVSAAGTASVNQRETALNICDAINRGAGGNKAVYAYYVAGVIGQPGRIVMKARSMPSIVTVSTSNAVAFRIGEVAANNPSRAGLVFSKPLQPSAFPVVNFFELGRGDAEILRIMPYRDSLLVFKADGLWRVTGTDWRSFSAQEFDLTFRLISRESVVALDDALYAWGVQGIARITDGGVEYLDAPIRDTVTGIVNEVLTSTMADFAFAVGRPRDGVVLFFYPRLDPSDLADPSYAVPCTDALVWHARTRTWATWDFATAVNANVGYVCGASNFSDGLVTLGTFFPAPAPGAFIHNERRAYVAADFSDPDMTNPAAPTMAASAIAETASWRELSSDALGSAQWIRARFDFAAASSIRQTSTGPFDIIFRGDNGTEAPFQTEIGTATSGTSTAVAPVGQNSSRSHTLTVAFSHSVLNEGVWLISASVDYRPFSTKAVR